ncbi:Crp/Fnr family transcriptional regulator [Aquabacterium sp. A7-Y]|uniref:Crp/Fnr family transcriptional regulator n=1 Tax=Aquabacterium sp. A7-Y TaxID=1349605 RepID=UPI00223D722A|nr:Crp/Fnr family transcriptional regulator [Aquabacterium sp. A7-Y]MCW7538750.1 Crp/Fnr family transcriptional regulator [Aquabacterium sp. A7-Y]
MSPSLAPSCLSLDPSPAHAAGAVGSDPPPARRARSRGARAPQGGAGPAALDARASVLQAALRHVELPRSALLALAGLGQEHEVVAGCPVLGRGDVAGALWLVLAGQVALGTRDAARPLQQTRLVEPGQWLDAASAWLGGAYFEDAWTLGDALLCSFPIEPLQRCCEQHPGLAVALLGVLAQRVGALTEGTLGLMLKDAEARCATWLLQHAEPGAAAVATVKLRERKRAIASQLAITPETFSRVFRQLREKRLIETEGYEVRLLDPEALRRIADGRR